MEISSLEYGSVLWDKTIMFAENCSWKAGAYLARLMRENSFNGWEKVFAACENDNVIGFCTLTEHDELPEDCGYSPFIGFVFIDEAYRGNRIAGSMIDFVCNYALTLGFDKMYICSGEVGLYEKYGFIKIGKMNTLYGTTEQLFVKRIC